MKYSIFALSALATAVAAVQPVLLNSNYELKEGEPFEIKYSGCDTGKGCTIILQTGESKALSDVTTLTAEASGTSFTWTPSGIPSGTYNFKIVSNDDPTELNYSVRFEYSGTGTLTTSSGSVSAATATGSSTAVSSAPVSSSAVSSVVSSASSAVSSVVSSSAVSSIGRNATITTTLTTAASSKPVEITTTTKKSEEPASKTTAAATTAATTVPDSGANRVASSLALVAGAVMAMVYLN